MADPRTLAENTARFAGRDEAAAAAAVAPLSVWPGWATVAWADAYHGPDSGAPTPASGVALTLQWGQISTGQKKAEIRHASLRLACCAWKPAAGIGDEFPWFEPDEAPDEILAAVSEMALHYARNPERRFEAIGAESERDVAGNSFGFRYGYLREFYGDIPATVMGMIQRYIESPKATAAVKQSAEPTARRLRLWNLPGWGMRKAGGP